MSALFLCYLLVGQSNPDQPAHLSTKYRPPIIPPRGQADCKNRQNTSVIMSKQQQTVDSSLSGRIQRCFSQNPYGSHQCGCENWDVSLLLPHILPTPLWDAPPQYNLGADKGSGATEQGSHYMMLGEQDSWNKVNIRPIIVWERGFFW